MNVGVERTDGGRMLSVGRRIDASAETVWHLLTDTERWPEWGPTVTAVDAPERYVSAGLTGRVRTVAGAWLDFEVTACRDRYWRWRVAGVAATGHRVEKTSTDTCRVRFEVPLVGALYLTVCAVALRRIEQMALAR